MTQISGRIAAEQATIVPEQAGRVDFLFIIPSRRTVGDDIASVARPDDWHEDIAGRGDGRASMKIAGLQAYNKNNHQEVRGQ